MSEYAIFVSLQDGGSRQVFGKLIVPIASGSDGYNEDCVVNEIMNAVNAAEVRDCVWTAEPAGDGVKICVDCGKPGTLKGCVDDKLRCLPCIQDRQHYKEMMETLRKTLEDLDNLQRKIFKKR